MRIALAAVALAIATPSAAADSPSVALSGVIERSAFNGDVAASFDGISVNYGHIDMLPKPVRNKSARHDKNEILWRWASVTKQVIAVLALQEVAQGRIDLDKPVARYLPGFVSSNAKLATVRQLLRHQAGLPNPDDSGGTEAEIAAFYRPGYSGSRDPLTGYCAGPPKAAPGGNWEYNNCDYMVAGALLETVTGKSWQTLVRQRIARPFGLKTVGAFRTRKPVRRVVIDGKPEPAIDLAAFGAAAGLYGSIDDMVKFDLALMNGALLPEAQRTELWDGQPNLGFIALGQWVFTAKLAGCAAPVRIVERRGAIGGVEIRNFILPDRRLALAAMSHAQPFDFGEIWQGKGFSFDLLSAAACT